MQKINNIYGLLTALNNTKINIQNDLNDVEKLITVKNKEKKQVNEINIQKNNNNNINIKNNKINNVNNNIIYINEKENMSNKKNNNQIKLKPKLKTNTKLKKINLIYFVKYESNCNIFGNEFVKNNKDNIELIVNGEE